MKPKILLIDIETAPILANVWDIWKQDISIDMIDRDWFILAFGAKWLDSNKVVYYDQKNKADIEDDSALLKKAWKLIDQADIIISQNGIRFDVPRLNTRFIKHKMKPPSSFKHIDTYKIAKSKFNFTSNKLEFLADFLGVEHRKSKHPEFPGYSLWKQCLQNNPKAWAVMQEYNIYDVLVLEAVYKRLQAWDTSINFSVYEENKELICACGSRNFNKNGIKYLQNGKYQRYICKACGREIRGNKNLFTKKRGKK